MRRQHVHLLGLDEFNLEKLEHLPRAAELSFHETLSYEESHGAVEYRPLELLDKARRRLEAEKAPKDAIVGFWDFPVSLIMTILGKEYGTRAGTLESVLQCEHKYWARIRQRESVPEMTPPFALVDPFDDHAWSKLELKPPFWLKPVKSFAAHLGFRIEDEQDFRRATAVLREEIHRFGKPFDELLSFAQRPDDLPAVGGHFAVAEGLIDGDQCTVEGWVLDGEVHAHGIVDSHRFPNKVSFHHYEYPSQLPEAVQQRMLDATGRVLRHVGLDNQTFNVEFFYDAPKDALWLLEINPRCSQSHADLFQKVDGAPNQEVTVSVGLGRSPQMPHRAGPYGVAAKFFLRYLGEDGRVTRLPDERNIRRIRAAFPGTIVFPKVTLGERLSETHYQDSYSYHLAFVYMGGRNRDELLENWEECKKLLDFGVEPIGRRPTPGEGGIRADGSPNAEARP